MSRILKIGLIAFGVSVSSMVLLMVLSQFGVAQFGPCGPDPFGLVLMLGSLLAGALGLLLTTGGLLEMGWRKLRS
jgi:hypothetical protein